VLSPEHCFVQTQFYQNDLKETVSRDFLLWFFHESSSLKPEKKIWDHFQFFSETSRDIRKSGCTTGISNTGGKLPMISRTPAVNLPMTQLANNGNNVRLLTP
jgi:hypothetical protein